MARRTGTRERLVRTAAALLRRQGYSATGLNQVLTEGGAPKGVLYFHFPGGKEQLAAESIALSGSELGGAMAAALTSAPDPAAGLAALGEMFARMLEESGFREGCPVATVALEAADNEPIRSACDGVYCAWLDGLIRRLHGWGVPEEEAAPLATVVFSALQGALMLARVQRDADVVRRVTQRVAGLVADAVRP